MPWMTTEEAARELGYQVTTIRYLLREGLLKGKHYGRVWFVDPEALADFKRRVDAEGFSKHDPRRSQLR